MIHFQALFLFPFALSISQPGQLCNFSCMNTSHWKQYIFLHLGQTDGASSFPLAPERSNFKLHAKQFVASSLAASFSSCISTGRSVQSGTNSAINFAFTNLEWCDRKKMVI